MLPSRSLACIRRAAAVKAAAAVGIGKHDLVLRDRARNCSDRGLDLVHSVIAAEAEANALSAHVGDDVGAREPIMDRLRARQFEGEEMPAGRSGRDWCDQ